jgi:outer membrane protein
MDDYLCSVFKIKKLAMKKILFIVFLFAVVSFQASAQKYGHLNFGNLIAAMPETKDADSKLETYQKELVTKGETMVKSFQQKYGQFVSDVQSGALAPKDQETRQLALQNEQQSILAYEDEVIQKVQTRRQELLKPIIDKAQKAIDDYAKANGYKMIFDTSVFNAVLFVKETDDLMDEIKAKLGL